MRTNTTPLLALVAALVLTTSAVGLLGPTDAVAAPVGLPAEAKAILAAAEATGLVSDHPTLAAATTAFYQAAGLAAPAHLDLPAGMQGPVASILQAAAQSMRMVGAGGLDPADIDALRENPPSAIALATQQAASSQAAIHLLLTMQAVTPELEQACNDAGAFYEEDALGYLQVGGSGENHYDDAWWSLDCGGNDRYTGDHIGSAPLLPSVGFAVDLGGNDLYFTEAEPDNYREGAEAVTTQGSGSIGVGILWDRGGDDAYIAHQGASELSFNAQGVGRLGGIGILLDDSGDDLYQSTSSNDAVSLAQGVGYVGGLGILQDSGGTNAFVAQLGGDEEESTTHAQGVGAWGAIGVLLLGDGDDLVSATMQGDRGAAQGVGTSVSDAVGYLADSGGDDTYLFAATSATNPCPYTPPEPPESIEDVVGDPGVDGLGDDIFGFDLLCFLEHTLDEKHVMPKGHFVTQGASQSLAGQGVLHDQAGNDRYVAVLDASGGQSPGELGAQGASLYPSALGALVDEGGDDQYEIHTRNAYLQCQGNVHAWNGAGILWDRGGSDAFTVDHEGEREWAEPNCQDGAFLDE